MYPMKATLCTHDSIEDHMPNQLTEAQETERGEALVRVMRLKECRDDDGKKYSPPRYELAGWGNKTALGVFRTVKDIMNGRKE